MRDKMRSWLWQKENYLMDAGAAAYMRWLMRRRGADRRQWLWRERLSLFLGHVRRVI